MLSATVAKQEISQVIYFFLFAPGFRAFDFTSPGVAGSAPQISHEIFIDHRE